MKKLKFLHFGDLHLDMPFTSLGDEGTQSTTRRQELKECFDRIMMLALEEEVNILLISGDLFEHTYIRKSMITYINEKFKSLGDIKVFIAPGNHDPFLGDSYYSDFNWSDNVYILGQGRKRVLLEEYGACIYGTGFSYFYEKSSLVSEMQAENTEWINILLVHGTVDLGIGAGDYNPMTSQELETLEMDYIALGHFHNRLEALGRRGRIYNPGSPEPLGFDEPGDHGVFVGTITKENGENGSTLDIRFIKTAKRYYKPLDIHIEGCFSNEQVLDRISLTLYQEDLHAGIFDIRLKGYVERGFRPDLAWIHTFFAERVFFLKIRDEAVEEFDIDEIIKDPGLKGLFARKLLLLMETEQDEQKRKLYRVALHFGLQALENGDVEILHSTIS